MGTARAPVAGSGFCPPCNATESKPSFLSKVPPANFGLAVATPVSLRYPFFAAPPRRGSQSTSQMQNQKLCSGRDIQKLVFKLFQLGPDQRAFGNLSLHGAD